MLVRQARFLIRPMFQAVRCFAGVPNKRLVKALDKELEYEHGQYKIDESVGPFLSQSGFEIVDIDGVPQVVLKKSADGIDVEITFSARSPQDQPENQEEEAEEGDQQGENNFVDFQVMLKKSGDSKGLIYECSSVESEIHVNNVVYSDDIESADRETNYVNKTSYRGPDFTTLDEKVQNAFVEHLKSFGVTEDLAIFVETYSLDKEHRLYMEWLRNVKNFLA